MITAIESAGGKKETANDAGDFSMLLFGASVADDGDVVADFLPFDVVDLVVRR